jgi:hypothetical protein
VNALLRLLLEELDRREREAALSRAYESLGRSRESDVSRHFKAQAEVVRRG